MPLPPLVAWPSCCRRVALTALLLAAGAVAAATAQATYHNCPGVSQQLRPEKSPYFVELTCSEQARWTQDKLTAIVEYVKRVQATCKKGRPRIPLDQVFGQDISKVVYTDFLKYQRTALSIANLLNHIHQSAGEDKNFETWFRQDAGRNVAYEVSLY